MASSDPIENKAITYFKDLITECKFPISFAFIQLQIEHNAPEDIQKLMNQKYAGDKLYDFFKQYPNLFSVSKIGIVTLATGSNVQIGQFDTIKRDLKLENKVKFYYESILRTKFLGVPVLASTLCNFINSASSDIVNYLNRLYPGETFELFFYRFPETFTVSPTMLVSLKECKVQQNPSGGFFTNIVQQIPNLIQAFDNGRLEQEAINYFRNILTTRYDEPVPYMNLRGHLGQASDEVVDYMNDEYPGNEFLNFFKKNSHIFKVSRRGNIFLKTQSFLHNF